MSWAEVLVAFISAGLLKYVYDGVRWLVKRRRAQSPEARQSLAISTVDQSLAVVARARDELEADNARLRAERAEIEARHEAERARWDLRDKARREEIEVLEAKLRALLAEVERLKDEHTYDELERARNRIDRP